MVQRRLNYVWLGLTALSSVFCFAKQAARSGIWGNSIFDWSEHGKSILARLGKPDGLRMVLISVADGSVRVLKAEGVSLTVRNGYGEVLHHAVTYTSCRWSCVRRAGDLFGGDQGRARIHCSRRVGLMDGLRNHPDGQRIAFTGGRLE
jgi:hypothetical protein